MTSLHSSVMEETGRLGVDVFIDNGGIFRNVDTSNVCGTILNIILCMCAGKSQVYTHVPSNEAVSNATRHYF